MPSSCKSQGSVPLSFIIGTTPSTYVYMWYICTLCSEIINTFRLNLNSRRKIHVAIIIIIIKLIYFNCIDCHKSEDIFRINLSLNESIAIIK